MVEYIVLLVVLRKSPFLNRFHQCIILLSFISPFSNHCNHFLHFLYMFCYLKCIFWMFLISLHLSLILSCKLLMDLLQLVKIIHLLILVFKVFTIKSFNKKYFFLLFILFIFPLCFHSFIITNFPHLRFVNFEYLNYLFILLI